jgi:adenosylcobinamide kinase/adenosylcobinamide-phosphate guanylyltransferase
VPLTLVTGPVRSGKSLFAEQLALAAGVPVTYVATARVDAGDAEWEARLAHHAARRPPGWTVIETAVLEDDALARIAGEAPAAQALLIDSLGTWLDAAIARRLLAARQPETFALDAADLELACERLSDALARSAGHTIVVGEEVGWGIVPAFPSGRTFRDVLGRLQQRVARAADAVFLVVAGYALDLRAHGRAIGSEREGA